MCWSIVACLVVTTTATSATAQNKAVGIGLGVGAGLLLLNEAAKAMQNPQQQRQQRPQGQRQSSGGDSSGERAAPKKTAEQRAQELKSYAAANEEWQERERSKRQEAERDVDGAISSFIDSLRREFKTKQGGRDAAINVSFNINQVTEGEVKRLVESAFEIGRLNQFERLPGEMWTRNRLMVRILRESERELGAYFKGVGVRGTSKDDLRNIFEQSSKRVYSQAIETAEIVGVSYSFDRFIRTIFEHSDQVPDSLSTQGADGHYERLVSETIESIPRELFVAHQGDQSITSDPLGLQRHFLYRFRARRAVYDCISSNYLGIVRGGNSGRIIDASTTGTGTAPTPNRNDAKPTLQPVTVETGSATTLLELPQAWRRMHEYTGKTCRTVLAQVATESKDGRLEPKPARWDSSLGESQWKPVIPAGNLYGVPTPTQQ
ncbi:MAG: hypothetical protein ACOYLQ_14440 [Hyphomicrobiaceae bacterium]